MCCILCNLTAKCLQRFSFGPVLDSTHKSHFSGVHKSCTGIIYNIDEAFCLFYSIFLEVSITSTSIYEEMECLDMIIPPLRPQCRSAKPSSYIQIKAAEAAMSVKISAPYSNLYFMEWIDHYWSQQSAGFMQQLSPLLFKPSEGQRMMSACSGAQTPTFKPFFQPDR